MMIPGTNMQSVIQAVSFYISGRVPNMSVLSFQCSRISTVLYYLPKIMAISIRKSKLRKYLTVSINFLSVAPTSCVLHYHQKVSTVGPAASRFESLFRCVAKSCPEKPPRSPLRLVSMQNIKSHDTSNSSKVC